ncbi:MAG: hypothetical protein PHU60_02380, partial [Tissierellia bacterium]|nr:hypothetical protein [Tissierellia bacterium]
QNKQYSKSKQTTQIFDLVSVAYPEQSEGSQTTQIFDLVSVAYPEQRKDLSFEMMRFFELNLSE